MAVPSGGLAASHLAAPPSSRHEGVAQSSLGSNPRLDSEHSLAEILSP